MEPFVVRAGERAVTRTSWLTSRHGFSFGDHYDPGNTHHGVLLVQNEELVAPGRGFDTHPHADTEIVTWVLSGSLVHQDSRGHTGVVHRGLAQRMSAGSGIEHSERNDHPESGDEPVHYIQMWVMPDDHGIDPGYEHRDIEGDLVPGALVPVASGEPGVDSAIRIASSGATLHAARLDAGQSVRVPPGRFTHLFVTAGSVDVDGVRLDPSDTLRAVDFAGTAVTAVTAAEVLVWSMSRGLGE